MADQQLDLSQQNLPKQKKVILNIIKKNNSLNTNSANNNSIANSDTINPLTSIVVAVNNTQNHLDQKKVPTTDEDPVASDESSISKQQLSSLTRASLMKKNSCLLSSSSQKNKEDADEDGGSHKVSALKRFRKAAFGIKFTQALGRDLNSELNKEFVDLKNPNDFQIVVDLLEKTTKKTMREILFLKRAVEGLRFFQQRKDNLNPKLYEILFDEFKVKLFKKQEVIYHYGDAPNNFYIVLKGSCYLLTPNEEQKTRNQQYEFNRLKGLYDSSRNGQVVSLESSNTYFSGFSTDAGKRNSKTGSKSSLYNASLPSSKSNDNPEYWDSFNNFLNLCFNGFQVTCDYLPGDSFGDLALTTRSKQAGTVVLGEDSYLLSLTKEGYEHILGEEQKQIVKNKITYFRQFQFLKNFTDAGLINMLGSLCNLSYKKGDAIYREGDSQEQINSNHNKNTTEESNQMAQLVTNSSNNLTENPDGRFTNLNCVLEEKKRQNGQILVKFAVLANNSCFGELEIIQQNKQRFQQAICHSLSLQVYAIKKEVLVNYLKAFEGYKLMEEYSNAAQSERARRIEKAIHTSQIMMQSQLKEAQKINYTKSLSEKNVLSALGSSSSVDNLHAQGASQTSIQPAAFTSRTTRYNTEIHHDQNITQNNPSNYYQKIENNYSIVDQATMGFRTQQHNPSNFIESNQGQIFQTDSGRIMHQPSNLHSQDQSIPQQNVILPTKEELQMEMLEQTRQKIIQDLKLIDKKKRQIFSQLKNAQHSVPVSDAVNASSLDFGIDGSKKPKKNQKKQEILFDYLFVQTPLLSKILSPKDSLNNTRKHASSRASLEHVSKQSADLMGAIHKSMERYKGQQGTVLNVLPASENHRLPSLTSRREEFSNHGYLSCINLASSSTTKSHSDQRIEQNPGNNVQKNDFQANLAQKRDDTITYPSSLSKKDQSSSMSSLEHIQNSSNPLHFQLHQSSLNIHTEVLKIQKANNHALNSSNPQKKIALPKTGMARNSFPSLNQIVSPHQKNCFEDINSHKNINFPSNNSFNTHNNLSCNSSRLSLPNMSVNSIPSRQQLPQQQSSSQNLTNQPNDLQSIISHSLFHPIASPKRAFSINQHFKNANNSNNLTPKSHIADSNYNYLQRINNPNQKSSESKLINKHLSSSHQI